MLYVRVAMIFLLNGNNAMVAFSIFLLTLFSLDNSYHSAFQKAARKSGLVIQDEHVYRSRHLRL